MSHLFENVHKFDGKIKNLFTPTTTYTEEEKLKMFETFKPKLNSPSAKQMLDVLIRDIKIKTKNIQDEIDATDILASIITHKDCDELLGYIEEQLGDITLGQCPSGRVIRLFQIWTAMDH